MLVPAPYSFSSTVDVIDVGKLRVYLDIRKLAQVVCTVVQEVR